MMAMDKLWQAVSTCDLEGIRAAVQSGADLNAECEAGVPVLFHAIELAHLEVIRMLLGLGADPNFIVNQPAADVYTSKPLCYAMQFRFLVDYHKYHPVVELLATAGATNQDGHGLNVVMEPEIRERAMAWQRKQGK